MCFLGLSRDGSTRSIDSPHLSAGRGAQGQGMRYHDNQQAGVGKDRPSNIGASLINDDDDDDDDEPPSSPESDPGPSKSPPRTIHRHMRHKCYTPSRILSPFAVNRMK